MRHQVWETIRAKFGKGIWIGPHKGELPAWSFVDKLNPLGKCRCGNRKIYKDCHLPRDLKQEITHLAKRYNALEKIILVNKIDGLIATWKRRVLIPETQTLKEINNTLK